MYLSGIAKYSKSEVMHSVLVLHSTACHFTQ